MIIKDKLYKIENLEYYVMEILNYNNITYGFANQIGLNDESLNVYKIIYLDQNNNFNFVTDETLLNELIPKFENMIVESLQKENNI